MTDAQSATAVKYVYAFGAGATEGSGELKFLLGGKGAGLAEMSRLGIPVPPGFTITTEACLHYQQHGGFPAGLEDEAREHMRRLETELGRRFGDTHDPLLVSVRSGAPISMPGMMDTVLNLGLTRAVLDEHRGTDRERFWWDCYRRLLTMYGDVVLGVEAEALERPLARELAGAAAPREQDLSVAALRAVCTELEAVLARLAEPFPEDPWQQLWRAVAAVFESWNNPRAVHYRRLHEIGDDLGTGVNVQAMVFGNAGDDCATGVAFTRDPASGERRLYGEYLRNAQGEDLVAGTHTPHPIEGGADDPGLAGEFPEAYAELASVCATLERHFRNMQDVEFTIEHRKLFMLQTRAGKRSGPAALRIAVDMVEERLIDRREALRRVEPAHLVQVMAPVFRADERAQAVAAGRLLANGLPAGPGAASGRIAFTAARAAEMAADEPVLLVRDETSPEDIVGMHAAVGILTTRGGMTSHAAVVARGLGKPCIVGAASLQVDEERGVLEVDGQCLREGDYLSIDGTRGEILEGRLDAEPSEVVQALVRGDGATSGSVMVAAFERLMRWADRERRLGVRANADTPEDARVASTFGAEGIGLCRTEHMFFEEERIPWVRRLILADDARERRAALERLLPMQQADFEGIFRVLAGQPVTVRLLDPPLHEFLPSGREAIRELAAAMQISEESVAEKVEELREVNPMLGHRGCRLGITFPEIYRMQTEAIARAACRLVREGVPVHPEIMVPLTGTEAEMARLRREIEEVLGAIFAAEGIEVPMLIGTMIEVPRAALVASGIARHADFFSFGTNDLTQMTFGFSRDDAGRFLPHYLEAELLPFDPFARLDQEGVGQLVELASERGRMARPQLKLGVCGEHGGEPSSIEFFERCQLDYVSCSPYRVPIARLAAARARLAFGQGEPG